MSAIANLLTRAELCYEKGQFKMANGYLDEVGARLETDECTDAEYEKYEWLCEHTPDTTSAETPRANDQCTKCGGTKVYRYPSGNTGSCYDCQGKGYQTEKDIVRVKNYWAYRRGEIAQRKAALAADPVSKQPFPF